MRQPLYKFGDRFCKEVTAEVMGSKISGTAYVFVTGISLHSTMQGNEFRYKLSNNMPQAYSEPQTVEHSISEQQLTRMWQLANPVADAPIYIPPVTEPDNDNADGISEVVSEEP